MSSAISKTILLALALAGLADRASAFAGVGLARRVAVAPARSQLAMMAGKKKMDVREEKGYWPGEWVCADCGFIYAPSERIPFEEQPKGFVCPQCAGPRRRFVKKAGDVVGSLDDSALVIGTLAGLAAVAGLLYFGMQ
jgi:rubredoxin